MLCVLGVLCIENRIKFKERKKGKKEVKETGAYTHDTAITQYFHDLGLHGVLQDMRVRIKVGWDVQMQMKKNVGITQYFHVPGLRIKKKERERRILKRQ